MILDLMGSNNNPNWGFQILCLITISLIKNSLLYRNHFLFLVKVTLTLIQTQSEARSAYKVVTHTNWLQYLIQNYSYRPVTSEKDWRINGPTHKLTTIFSTKFCLWGYKNHWLWHNSLNWKMPILYQYTWYWSFL
jgi:hypothetical protein